MLRMSSPRQVGVWGDEKHHVADVSQPFVCANIHTHTLATTRLIIPKSRTLSWISTTLPNLPLPISLYITLSGCRRKKWNNTVTFLRETMTTEYWRRKCARLHIAHANINLWSDFREKRISYLSIGGGIGAVACSITKISWYFYIYSPAAMFEHQGRRQPRLRLLPVVV